MSEAREAREQAADAATSQVVSWLESELGGKVVSVDRQARWRPVWWAEVETDEGPLSLCVRGDRIDT